MDSPEKNLPADLDHSLETIELELALESLDLGGSPFEDRVESALESVGGSLLFYMPEACSPGVLKLAAVSTGHDDLRRTLLVLLEENGETIRVESCADHTSPIGAVAVSFAQLSERL